MGTIQLKDFLLAENSLNGREYAFTLYLWIDGNYENNPNMVENYKYNHLPTFFLNIIF